MLDALLVGKPSGQEAFAQSGNGGNFKGDVGLVEFYFVYGDGSMQKTVPLALYRGSIVRRVSDLWAQLHGSRCDP